MPVERTRTGTCPWCSDEIESDEQTVAIGPPPSLSSSVHRWELHEDCADEWRSFAEKLAQLSRSGAHQTLVEYPRQNGIDAVLAHGD